MSFNQPPPNFSAQPGQQMAQPGYPQPQAQQALATQADVASMFSTELWSQEAAEQFEQDTSKRSQYFKPKDGHNVIRFLPPPVGSNDPSIATAKHWIRGVDMAGQAKTVSHICAEWLQRRFPNQPALQSIKCPTCNYIRSFNGRVPPHLQAQIKDMELKPGVEWRIIDRSLGAHAYPQLWTLPVAASSFINLWRKTNNSVMFLDPMRGFDMSFVKRGKDKGTKYEGFQFAAMPSPLFLPNMKLAEFQHALNELSDASVLKVMTEDEVMRALHEAGIGHIFGQQTNFAVLPPGAQMPGQPMGMLPPGAQQFQAPQQMGFVQPTQQFQQPAGFTPPAAPAQVAPATFGQQPPAAPAFNPNVPQNAAQVGGGVVP